MSVYLGSFGRMVELKCPASQQLAVEDATSFETTLGGRRVGQVSPARGRRAWQLSLSDASTPGQVGAVMGFINREWGPGPFIFVSADAQVINLLTPDAAACDPAELVLGSGSVLLATPPMLTPDGWAGRSFLKNTVNGLFFGKTRTPIIPGVKVTGSAYVAGANGGVALTWYDAAGGGLGTVSSAVRSTGPVVRSHVSVMPPAGAVSVRVSVTTDVTQACRPAITWSDTLLEWGDGQGCMSAIAHGASRNLIMASRDPRGGRYSNLSFTVSEVG